MRSTSATIMSTRGLKPLPAIAEDRNSFQARGRSPSPPTVPPRAWNRPVNKIFGLGQPPRLQHDSSPPAYIALDSSRDVEGPNGEKLADVRRGITNNKHIARRGGWMKLVLVVLLILLCIVALVVGLAVGLRNRKHKSSNDTSSLPGGASGNVGNGPSSTSNATFPAGAYRIQTVLSSSTTNCTSNPSIWTCYPYTTYSVSQSSSRANFDWIISPPSTSDSNYTISTTQNIFTILFANISLSLINEGSDNEYYSFDIPLTKSTRPAAPLGTSNVAAACTFSNSILRAELYTKIGRTLNDTESEGSLPFQPWPYMVKIEQTAAPSAGIPQCVDLSGNYLGDFSSQDGECGCEYVNTGM